ncbi:hypothetical protein [Hyphobacterium sp.]|uniref:hypothetical protein n=1 Tax=Hyphobacterium sp. TaxID=2004662 RepID=UPI003B51BC39
MTESNEPEPVDAEFEPADDAVEAPKPRRGGAIGHVLTFLVAALAGGGLGGGIAWMLDRSTDAAPDPAVIEARLAALESEAPPEAFDASALEARISALESVQDVDLSPLENRISALETGDGETPDTEALSAIDVRLDAVEALANQALDAIGAQDTGVDPALIVNLQERIAALEAAGLDTAETLDLSGLEARLAALEGVSAPEAFDPGEIETRLAALETAVQSEFEALTSRIATLEADSDDGGRQLAARALALTALIERARTAQPFETERAVLARVWPDLPQNDLLFMQSRSGVPDRDTIAETFPREALEDAIGTNRVFFGLIELRPSRGSDVSPQAHLLLIEERLAEGDLAGAVFLTTELDDAPRLAAQGWLIQAQARLELDALLTALRTELLEDAAAMGADPT